MINLSMVATSTASLPLLAVGNPTGPTLEGSLTIERIGWALLHSTWQFALVALIAGLIDLCLGRTSARGRYVLYAAALTAIFVLPAVTFFCVRVDEPVPVTTPDPLPEAATTVVREAPSRGGPKADLSALPPSAALPPPAAFRSSSAPSPADFSVPDFSVM